MPTRIDAGGNTLGILGILQDITEDKRNRAFQERRIHELEGALSERVGQVESLRHNLEKISAERREKEEELGRLRSGLQAEITALREDVSGKAALLERKETEFSRARSEMESELQARREDIHRLRNELQKEIYERGQAVEALKKSVAHSQELLESVQRPAGMR